MKTLLFKEIKSFFYSITGYFIAIIFLLMNGLALWVFSSYFNIIDGGSATLSPYFYMAPWIFLFLIPATTMHSFSQEYTAGTIELLMTKPISSRRIVLAKYLASFLVVFICLVPTLTYFISIYQLALPRGNIDTGAIIGSYIGLLWLAGVYVAIGIFASSLIKNQIIAFLLGVVLCFTLFMGIDYLALSDTLSSIAKPLLQLSLNEHYKSISRGVIVGEDIFYYLAVILLFLYASTYTLKSKIWK